MASPSMARSTSSLLSDEEFLLMLGRYDGLIHPDIASRCLCPDHPSFWAPLGSCRLCGSPLVCDGAEGHSCKNTCDQGVIW